MSDARDTAGTLLRSMDYSQRNLERPGVRDIHFLSFAGLEVEWWTR